MLVSRTVRVDEVYWSAIMKHFRNSPDGTTGSEVIRQTIRILGEWCIERQEQNIRPSMNEGTDALGLVFSRLQAIDEENS